MVKTKALQPARTSTLIACRFKLKTDSSFFIFLCTFLNSSLLIHREKKMFSVIFLPASTLTGQTDENEAWACRYKVSN